MEDVPKPRLETARGISTGAINRIPTLVFQALHKSLRHWKQNESNEVMENGSLSMLSESTGNINYTSIVV